LTPDGGEWSPSLATRFTRGKEPAVYIEYEPWWALEPVWTLLERYIS